MAVPPRLGLSHIQYGGGGAGCRCSVGAFPPLCPGLPHFNLVNKAEITIQIQTSPKLLNKSSSRQHTD